ncbi:hypothetical protein H2203_001599 [Taxawa tesnikishii (nom. ined.)]|nr:hypothetical protein H2203_001599 [Dothideales sp. JES 119]
MDTTADFGFDTITMGYTKFDGAPSVDHAVIGRVADFNFWLGIFGLNPRPTNFTTFNAPQPSFMTQLRNENNTQIPSLTWAYTAGNQYRFNNVYGSLVLGGYDAARFDASKAVSFPFHADVGRDLVVSVKTITHSEAGTLSSTAFPAFIDSTVPHLWLPKDVCKNFEKAFGLTYDEDYGLYLVNSSLHTQLQQQNASVTLTLAAPNGTVDITLPYSAFDLQASWPVIVEHQFTANDTPSNTSYYFPLKRADNETQYTLGRAFLQEAYLIADYDRSNFTVAPCIWDNAIQNNQIDIKSILAPNTTLPDGTNGEAEADSAPAPSSASSSASSPSSPSSAPSSKAKRISELEATEAAAAAREREKSSTDESKPFISAPMGGELAGGEIHEMASPYKPAAAEMDSPYRIDPNKVGYSEVEGSGPVEYFGKNGRVGAQEPYCSSPAKLVFREEQALSASAEAREVDAR